MTGPSHLSGTAASSSWLCRIDPALSGRRNMEIDRELLARAERSPEPMTVLRFYGWRRQTVSIGRNQPAEQVADLDFCSRQGIEVVRRPTGGAAVLHGTDLTYAVVSNQLETYGESISATYREIGRSLQEGFRLYGIETRLMRAALSKGVRRVEPCFLRAGREELLAGKKKLAGSAQRRLRRSFLQHGSIPLTIDYEWMARALRSSAEALQSTVTCVSEHRSAPVRFEELAEALRAGFEAVFNVRMRSA